MQLEADLTPQYLDHWVKLKNFDYSVSFILFHFLFLNEGVGIIALDIIDLLTLLSFFEKFLGFCSHKLNFVSSVVVTFLHNMRFGKYLSAITMKIYA